MKEQSETRAVILGEYIVRQKATVRAAAEWFGVSKSTVHKDVSERLEQIQPDLYTQVKEILEQENIFVMDDTRAMHQWRSRHQTKICPAPPAGRGISASAKHMTKIPCLLFGETGYFS